MIVDLSLDFNEKKDRELLNSIAKSKSLESDTVIGFDFIQFIKKTKDADTIINVIKYIDETYVGTHTWLNSVDNIVELSELVGKSESEHNCLRKLLYRAIKGFRTTYSNDLIRLYKAAKAIDLPKDDTKRIALNIISNDRISIWSHKKLFKEIKELLDFKNNEDNVIHFMNHRVDELSKMELLNCAKLISGGLNNPKLGFMSQTKFKLALYTTDQLKNSDTKRRILMDASKVMGGSNYLRSKVKVTKKDILNLPPVSRFRFLKWYFADALYYARYAIMPRNADPQKPRNICINENISIKEVKEMLFSVSISRHAEVTNFVKDYSRCKNNGLL